MANFSDAFRAMVGPDLRRMCANRGLFVALGLDGFADACDEVIAEARKRGAAHLPDAVHRQLEDWISATLLEAIDAAMPTVRAAEAATDSRLWAVILERPWPTMT